MFSRAKHMFHLWKKLNAIYAEINDCSLVVLQLHLISFELFFIKKLVNLSIIAFEKKMKSFEI